MSGVLVGFTIIASIIGVGYVVGRVNLLGVGARQVLARLVFFVLAPCLLFTILADARVDQLFSPLLIVSLIAAVAAFAVFGFCALYLWRRSVPDAVIGMLSAGYVNANNIGLPVALYVLGDAAFVAPVLLLQLLVISPIALAVLDSATSGQTSWRRICMQPVRNPIIIGSAAGVLVTLTDLSIPVAVMEPFRIIGAATVPLMLISYGISLHGQRPLRAGSGRRDVLLATLLKVILMPGVAWAVGRFGFGLAGQELFAVVALAALPTAQNVFNYAQRYDRAEPIARDTILLTTIGSMPVLVLIVALLHPAG